MTSQQKHPPKFFTHVRDESFIVCKRPQLDPLYLRDGCARFAKLHVRDTTRTPPVKRLRASPGQGEIPGYELRKKTTLGQIGSRTQRVVGLNIQAKSHGMSASKGESNKQINLYALIGRLVDDQQIYADKQLLQPKLLSYT